VLRSVCFRRRRFTCFYFRLMDQAPTTLGMLCDPTHPALVAFPTDM
jgi:hypothetical protein